MRENNSNLFIIFGGTGDLTHRKLIPAIYNLAKENLLPKYFALVSIGRRDYTNAMYHEQIEESVKSYSRLHFEADVFNQIKNKIYYKKMNFTNKEEYTLLSHYLKELDDIHHTSYNHIYYLAVAPRFFDVIVDNLHETCMNESDSGYHRVVIEKPFGKDLKSAKYLNDKIITAFKEENTFRIDHYLGKEMLQNIMVIRFANQLFEPLWNNQYIEQVQLSSNETLGVGTRGPYYEQSGAIRDMVQSHMLQLLSLVAMEKPRNLEANSIRDEKVEVLKKLTKYNKTEIIDNVIRGQYNENKKMPAYRNEIKVAKDSNTETFVALKLKINSKRWKNVPFYIRTGKRMPKKSTEIIIQFREPQNNIYHKTNLLPNTLVIKIQPREGVYLQFNAKKPGSKTIIPVQMDFCQNCQVGINSPEAYERLLLDVMNGDQTLFARWDEVYYSWEFIDKIVEVWEETHPNFPNYKAGTWGLKQFK